MATRKQVKEFAKTLPDVYLECRQFGHKWRARTAKKDGPRWRVTTICDCESINNITLDAKGLRVGKPRPKYAPGYLAHGMGRITGEAKGELNLEGLRRIISTAEESPTES